MALSGSTDFSVNRDQLIKAAFRLIGVYSSGSGDEPSATEISEASETLNLMVKSWVADGLQLFVLKNTEFTLLANTQSYTVGLAGDIPIVRPERFINIVYRDSSTFDRILNIIPRQEYWALSNKSSKGSPVSAYYDPQLTLGRLYLWPVLETIDATTPEKIVLIYQDIFDDMDSSTDDFEFPQYYLNAIKWNLAVQLGYEYGIPNERLVLLKQQATEEKFRAMDYDQEQASIYIQPESRWYRGLD